MEHKFKVGEFIAKQIYITYDGITVAVVPKGKTSRVLWAEPFSEKPDKLKEPK